MSSSAKLPDISQKASSAASFINDIFKRVNFPPKMTTTQDKTSFPYSLPTSYASTITSQQPGNTFQPSSASYQAPPPAGAYQGAPTSSYPNQAPTGSYPNQAPTSSYLNQAPTSSYPNQASIGSYPNQAPYQHPNTNMPFGSIPGLNEKSIPQSQVFNYSSFKSSPTSKNYPRKY